MPKNRLWGGVWLPCLGACAVATWLFLTFAMHGTLHKEEASSVGRNLVELNSRGAAAAVLRSSSSDNSQGILDGGVGFMQQRLQVLDREIDELQKVKAQHDLASKLAEDMRAASQRKRAASSASSSSSFSDPQSITADSLRGVTNPQAFTSSAGDVSGAVSPAVPQLLPPLPPQPPIPLAPATVWEEYRDAATGKPYFHNKATGETSWENKPTGSSSLLDAAAAAAAVATTATGGGAATADTKPSAVKQLLSSGSSMCEMLDGVDFAIPSFGASEVAVEGLSLEGCCERCRNVNALEGGQGGCEVAVYSSASDHPPNACWLKSKIDRNVPARAKQGVKAVCPRPGLLASLPPPPLLLDGTSTGGGGAGSGTRGSGGGGGGGSGGGVGVMEYRGGGSTDARYASWAKQLGFSHLMELPVDPSTTTTNTAAAAAAAGSSESSSSGSSGEESRSGSDSSSSHESVLRGRCNAIKGAMKHCWSNYREHAWGMDNISPMSGRGSGGGFNHAVTMVDSLDTLWLMGMQTEFNDGVKWLKDNFASRISRLGGGTSLFETTIRTLGGLLAAFDLSKDQTLLKLAVQLGDKISARTSSEGVSPYMFGGGSGGMGCPSLAESGTMQVEMNYLSQATGNPSYARKANAFYATVSSKPSLDGLWPNCWQHGRGRITFGADGDSFYEYLVKGWLQTGKTDERLWRMYNDAIDGMEKWLVKAAPDGLTYLNNLNMRSSSGGSSDPAMEHLACFVPGWLALGIPYQTDPSRAAIHLKLAEELAFTCWQMYERQPTGIGPERVKGLAIDLSKTDTKEYILRPEAAEGWWYMYELTGKEMYRDWGWKTFVAFEKHLKVSHGYASLQNVRSDRPAKIDRMESFFMAETLKYLYLLQDPSRPIRLDTHVLNTEAHPFRIPGAS